MFFRYAKFESRSFIQAPLGLQKGACGARQCVAKATIHKDSIWEDDSLRCDRKAVKDPMKLGRCHKCGTPTKGRHRQQVEQTSGDFMGLKWKIV